MEVNKLQAFEYHYRRANWGIPIKEEYKQAYKEAADTVIGLYANLSPDAKTVFDNILAIGRREVTESNAVVNELMLTGLFTKEDTHGRIYLSKA